MKPLFVLFALAMPVIAMRAALPQPNLIAQIHFSGAQKILTATNSVAFTNEFCSTEALALRAEVAAKLSGWLSGWLQTNLNVTVAGGAAKLRPLFEDLQTAEFFAEARIAPTGRPELAICIKLDASRAQLWQANLKLFFAAASFKSAGGWLIFDSDPALLNLGEKLAQKTAAPSADWFDLDINWPLLAKWYPKLKELALPETQFTVAAPDNNFRINGKFFFPENLALNLEPWRVPTNTLHQPFNGFTAVRGFASWFQSQTWAQPYQITPPPNQLFIWSLPYAPFQIFAAIPVPDSANVLAQTFARVTPVFMDANARNYFISRITAELTNNEIVWFGTPYMAPNLKAVTEPGGQFLVMGLFPNSPRSKPLPPELFTRLATKDLVYYHWEITAERIAQLLNLSQLGLLLTRHKQLESTTAPRKWLQRAGSAFGNTDTEIIQSGPAEFTFARKTPSIFTATELLTLANWLEATNFPGCDLKLPPPPPHIQRQRQQPFQLTTPPPPGQKK